MASGRQNLPFSPFIQVGNTLYISGHIGLDASGKPGATAQEEARLMMDGFKKTIESGGMTMDDLVSVTIFCSDVKLFEEFNAIYRTYFSGRLPTRAFIGSGALLFGARFEVLGIAARG